MTPRFSLIIPAYNERELLPRLLETVRLARERYHGGPQAIEVIVADNASTDSTAAIARDAGCRVVPVPKRCIAAARNGGARVALGEVLCFVDADSIVHPDTFEVIERGLTERVVGGTTGVVPERWTLGLRVTYAILFPALWLFDMDAGVVFCRRGDFEAISGYNEQRMYAEDVQLLLDLRRLGKRSAPRRRLARLAGARTLTSNRKYDKHGQWHFLTESLRHALLFHIRPEITAAFDQRYWYEDR